MQIQSKPEGAELTSIIYRGEEKLHDGKIAWSRQCPVLFPIVGKLNHDTANIDRKTYSMTQHGFARDSLFEVIEKTDTIHSYQLVSDEKTKAHYPYDFCLRVTYVVEENMLTVMYEVKNTGNQNIPFGIGGHPAFQLAYPDVYIEFEKNEGGYVSCYQLKDGIIEAEYERRLLDNKLYLEEDSFNQDAIIMKELKSESVTVKTKQDDKPILKFSFKGFPYLAFWSKNGAPFLCIEPWYSVADKKGYMGEFREKEGTILLPSGQTFTCSYQVTFLPT